MNRRRGGLGSGLDALIPGTAQPGGVREVATSNIYQNSRQPRTHFDEEALDELAASIREHGVIQPLIVSERGEGRYELIAGERRWRAAQRAGFDRVPVIVRETTSQQQLELALIENVQRADLNALEEAQAYQSLVDDFGLTDGEIAQKLGKNSRVTIANTRRLLKLPPQARDAILKNKISAGHGRALLKLDTEDQQQAALEAIVLHDLSVREAERISEATKEFGGDIQHAVAAIRDRRAQHSEDGRHTVAPPQKSAPPRSNTLSAEDQETKRQMEQLLGTPVSIARNEKNLRVTIEFHTEEKLQEFFDILNAERLRL